MRKHCRVFAGLAIFAVLFFGVMTVFESAAWARAGGGGSSGSRGSRSFSSPSMPSSPSPSSPGIGSPGRPSFPGSPSQPSGGFFSRSPFMQGLAGGLAGGLLGSMLFGGTGHAAPGGVAGGGGMGLLDLVIIGLLLYFAYRFFMKRRAQTVASKYEDHGAYRDTGSYSEPQSYTTLPQSGYYPGTSEVERGFEQMRRLDPGFSEEALKETLQDVFFRIQAAWMNRSLDGIEKLVTSEMAGYFLSEFDSMKKKGRINRLENIAVRKVEPSEVWQESGRDYVTVLFTANLLDYTVHDVTGEVIGGDKLNPVKFQEFWTFCRDVGSTQWKLSGINQVDEASARVN